MVNIEQIEKIKQEYTDKYVVVDAERPELARFREFVGQVKTVNMSGRALVEFHDYYLNIGWYDIELDYLKVVDKPAPKEKAKSKPAAKPAPKPASLAPKDAKLSPLEKARQEGPASKGKDEGKAKESVAPAAREKMSVSDVLAAARGKKSEGTTATAAKTPSKKPAEAKKEPPPTAAAAGAKTDRSKMSVADMLAAARSEKTDGGAASSSDATPATEPAPAKDITPSPAPDEASAEPTPPEATPQSPPAASSGKVDRDSMSVDEMIAWCREHDGS